MQLIDEVMFFYGLKELKTLKSSVLTESRGV